MRSRLNFTSPNDLRTLLRYVAARHYSNVAQRFLNVMCLVGTVGLLKQVRPRMMFVGLEGVTLIENALDEAQLQSEIVVFGPSEKHFLFSAFLRPISGETHFQPFYAQSNMDTALILFSSGATGFPKGICVTHYGVICQSINLSGHGINFERSMCLSSLYWISSTLFLTSAILFGTCRVVYPKFELGTIWKILEKFKITNILLPPTQAAAMAKMGCPKEIDLSSLSHCYIGGGLFRSNQALKFRQTIPHIYINIIYGQTEFVGASTMFHMRLKNELVEDTPLSVGRLLPGFCCRIVDIETEETVGPNKSGELRVKTKFQMNGYYQKDSSACWDSQGWLKTGDIGYYDEDNYFYIVDRMKDMLKYQSWHVPPVVLEDILLNHPAVQEAVVIGLPHPEDGEQVDKQQGFEHTLHIKLIRGLIRGLIENNGFPRIPRVLSRNY